MSSEIIGEHPTASRGRTGNFFRFRKNITHDLEGLECSDRAENLINRKIIKFYIETMSNFFLNSEKKITFFLDQKNSKKITKIFPKNPEIFQISNFWNFKICEIWKFSGFFGENFRDFFRRKFFDLFFDREKN